ncbi:Cof-type HAD-IIB family hydrolase [Falsibacillus albus]|uniref:HAD family phosphatase n=1 Tax=Falsibacillus albus TaxID=2478915 RepID=A0A3L7K2H8_9BACI|nr:Cof-type HAD-IIB family hydrolase [Falsibacillus albus]RLQ97213.1 HAD family phosphatase [Falsibacillus albus]
MPEKHLICLDLDGTLLTDKKTISDRTKTVISKAMEAGHKVIISTGRPYRSSEMYYKELNLNTPIVNFNGAFIHHPLDSKWGLYHSPLDIDVAKEIVDACQKYTIHNIVAEVMDEVYFHYHSEKLMDIFSLGNPDITTGDLRDYLTDSPTSLLIHAEESHVSEIREHLSTVHADLIDHRRWAAPWHVIEIVRNGIHKAVGVKKIAEYFNIPQQRIIAFGDEDNDLEMIEYAGIGVAMGNAIDNLKNIANEITLSNEDEGIAAFLEDRLNL